MDAIIEQELLRLRLDDPAILPAQGDVARVFGLGGASAACRKQVSSPSAAPRPRHQAALRTDKRARSLSSGRRET
jgi:hypothetical protein